MNGLNYKLNSTIKNLEVPWLHFEKDGFRKLDIVDQWLMEGTSYYKHTLKCDVRKKEKELLQVSLTEIIKNKILQSIDQFTGLM